MGSLISFIICLAFAIFLYIDAPKHNKSRWLWAILGFLFGPIALGIYFIKTERKVAGWIITILAILLYIVLIIVIVFAALLFANGFSWEKGQVCLSLFLSIPMVPIVSIQVILN